MSEKELGFGKPFIAHVVIGLGLLLDEGDLEADTFVSDASRQGIPITSRSPDSLAPSSERSRWSVIVGCCVWLAIMGCVAETKDAANRDVIGPYKTWDDVISRWIGGRTSDLYVELGPPNLHPHDLDNGMTEMVWDFGIDRMPGQADAYGLLPLYGENVNCQIHFFADAKGIITKGRKLGCE